MDGIEWIRILYAYPIFFTDDLIDTLAGSAKIIPYLDMPLQHISDRVLKRMQRRVRRRRDRDAARQAAAAIADLTLRTTFIVGFPGETEAEFDELADFIADGAIRAARRLPLFVRAGHARDASSTAILPRKSRPTGATA